jgi:hypothetical protein
MSETFWSILSSKCRVIIVQVISDEIKANGYLLSVILPEEKERGHLHRALPEPGIFEA